MDYTDPPSGQPAASQCSSLIYPDVDANCSLLNYDVLSIGCCGVVQHPSWGTRNYPGSIFLSNVTPEQVKLAIQEIEKEGLSR
jgi:hypothetical protein